jgi:hypothetical protein
MTIHLPTILNNLTRLEALLASLDRAMRELGERRRERNNSRWMNG